MADETMNYDPQDIQANKGMAILSYIGFLFLVPMLSKKESAFCRYHVNQGLVLFLAEVVLGFVVGILSVIPIIGILGAILSYVLYIGGFVLLILGVMHAAQGKAVPLPLIGGIKLYK